ncbi:MAG: PilZ domain-containing protein [Vulcanimicrobiota bacterium]
MLETRRSRRFDCDEAVDCEVRGAVRVAFLRDVSLTGARLQGSNLPPVGTLLRLAPTFSEWQPCGPRAWVYAQVAWTREGVEAGLRFLEPSSRLSLNWVGRLCQGRNERRNSIRVATEVYMEIKVPGVRRTYEALSLDLSQGGVQARLPDQVLRAGSIAKVSVCLPYTVLDMPAQVVRSGADDRPQHSLQFTAMETEQADALGGFLRQELAQQKRTRAADPFLARLFNRESAP